MAGVPSVGDLMMLSQLAWKIGCAFTSGRNGAPAEFQEVENELTGLTKSITLLTEALDRDDSVLARADEKTKDGLDKILECCRQTLENLNALVDQYQEIRRPDGTASLAVQRFWKPIFIRNYKKIWWTSEGGNIQALRNMLQMHVNSINLTLQALQSMSLSRLENTIEPMAERVAGIHDKLTGDLDQKIAEILNLMQNMMSIDASPRIWPASEDDAGLPEVVWSNELKKRRTNSRSATNSVSRQTDSEVYETPLTPTKTPELPDSGLSPKSLGPRSSRDSDLYDRQGLGLIPVERPPRVRSFDEAPPVYNNEWRSRMNSFPPARPPPIRPNLLQSSASDYPHAPQEHLATSHPVDLHALTERSIRSSISSNSYVSSQPSPEVSPNLPNMFPRSMIPLNSQVQSMQTDINDPLYVPKIIVAPDVTHRATATEMEHTLFVRELTRDSAILCEASGTCVEYTAPDEENPGEWKMTEAATACKIYIITKMQKHAHGSRFISSIWSMSDDRKVRVQQKLADGVEVVPYTIWGNNLKVVLRVSAELKFHDVTHSARPHQIIKTSWINYIFSDETGMCSALFQSILMGKTLILTLKTKRTLRVHDGLTSAFAFQEQLCGLENIRLWQDDNGDVLAMIHYSPHFRDGYLTFHVGYSSRKRIHFKDDGERYVRIKGLEVEGYAKDDRRVSIEAAKIKTPKAVKKITAVKIEFLDDDEKRVFLDKLREIQ